MLFQWEVLEAPQWDTAQLRLDCEQFQGSAPKTKGVQPSVSVYTFHPLCLAFSWRRTRRRLHLRWQVSRLKLPQPNRGATTCQKAVTHTAQREAAQSCHLFTPLSLRSGVTRQVCVRKERKKKLVLFERNLIKKSWELWPPCKVAPIS